MFASGALSGTKPGGGSSCPGSRFGLNVQTGCRFRASGEPCDVFATAARPAPHPACLLLESAARSFSSRYSQSYQR